MSHSSDPGADPATAPDRASSGLRSFFNHPAGLYPLFFTEMWERFSFYTMIALLSLYLNEYHHYSEADASNVTTWYNSLVYFTPFLGGLIADRLIGHPRAILCGGVLMMCGHLLLGFDRVGDTQHLILFGALALLILGNGLFKPNISTLVGSLYSRNDPRRDQGFTIFYMGINIGAFIAPLSANLLRRNAVRWSEALGFKVGSDAGWHIAFGSAGVGMLLSIVIFSFFRSRFGNADRRLEEAPGPNGAGGESTSTAGGDRAIRLGQMFNIIGVVVALSWLLVGPLIQWPDSIKAAALWPTDIIHFAGIWLTIELITIAIFVSGGDSVSADAAKLKAVFVVVALFWMAFHQNSVTLTFFARDNTATKWDAETFQAINPICIVLFSPLMVMLWTYLEKRNREPSPTTKIMMGMGVTGLAYLVMVGAGLSGGDSGRVSAGWLVGTYAIMTVAELWLSPIGMSLTSRLAPPKYKALWMGFWFTATAVGNKLVHVIGKFWTEYPHSKLFLVLVASSFGAAALLSILLFLLRWVGPRVKSA